MTEDPHATPLPKAVIVFIENMSLAVEMKTGAMAGPGEILSVLATNTIAQLHVEREMTGKASTLGMFRVVEGQLLLGDQLFEQLTADYRKLWEYTTGQTGQQDC